MLCNIYSACRHGLGKGWTCHHVVMWAVIGLANGGQNGLGEDAVWEIKHMGKAECARG